MPTASLSEFPKHTAFEEYVAAIFQSAGLFVERDLTVRQRIDLLQLDVIVTDYSTGVPDMRLVEAKSGDWSIKDLFKIRGWMHYLGIDAAALIATKPKQPFDTYCQTGERIGIDVVHIPEAADFNVAMKNLLPVDDIDPEDIISWRFCYWLERNLLSRLASQVQGAPNAQRFKAISDYAERVHDGVFFSDTISERVDKLYSAFGQYRNISSRAAIEKTRGEFPEEAEAIPDSLFQSTFYRCQLNEIQVACMVEHRARLALLKAAVDYLSLKASGLESEAEQTLTVKVGEKTYTLPLVSFPLRFQAALEELADEPYFRLYPVFWQWFLGVLGGFILLDYEDEEMALLSSKSGIPLEHIDSAFAAFDKLFPVDEGWFRTQSNSKIKLLMLYPSQLRGIGVDYRQRQYTELGDSADLKLTGAFTRRDLTKWKRAAVSALLWSQKG